MKGLLGTFVLAAALACAAAHAQEPVKIVGLLELSGPGATSGSHFKAGLELAAKEINASGGILGRKIALEINDTQTNPGIAKALATKAADDGAFAIFGPIFSGSVLVSMEEAKRAEIPNFVGGEATAITQRGNPYVFRTSFSQANAMPRVARYIAENMKAKSVAIVFVNNDFGKGGRDAVAKELQARGVQVVADIPTDQGQVDFSSPVVRVKQANADALFAYLTVDESARLLRELRKQGYDRPILGETTIMQQSVIDLAGEAANGARGHVGLTIDAPIASVRAFSEKFERDAKFKSSHEGLKAYIGLYTLKAVTEKVGKFDRKAVAQAMKNLQLSAAQYPGVLMDLAYDDKGDLDRVSFLVEVKNGKQAVVETLPPLRK
jgi:branched-chain amino acid transport system substrate-binding protein